MAGWTKRRRGAATLVILMLGAALFLLFAATLTAYMRLHRQNQQAMKRLQTQATAYHLKR